MSEHTPTPWRYQEKSDAYTHIVRSGERFIFQLSQNTNGESEATARFIVKAVNSHDAMVKKLEEIHDITQDTTLGMECWQKIQNLAATAASALASIKVRT